MKKPRCAEKYKTPVRIYAFLGLTSVQLFCLAGCGPNVKTVKRTTDQSKLAAIALSDAKAEVRQMALSKVVDQTVLGEIALNDKDAEVGCSATARLTNSDALASVPSHY